MSSEAARGARTGADMTAAEIDSWVSRGRPLCHAAEDSVSRGKVVFLARKQSQQTVSSIKWPSGLYVDVLDHVDDPDDRAYPVHRAYL